MTEIANTIVETKSGKINGIIENGLFVFKGIPFAEPPVGELRWLPPQPHKPWKDVRHARLFGTIAPQNPTKLPMMREFVEEEPQNEDCLFLNVWTPGLDDALRPVMVWIHGGAFSMGSGSQLMYRGGKLPKKGNIVLVTINYRLGVLGFLNLNEVTGGKIPSTGNEGLLDQIAALKWVKDNIAAFGGDPENVTIFGESAGGMSVACLMNMPEAHGLFQKAIIESAVGDIARPLAPSVKAAEKFLEIVGVNSKNVKALRSIPVDKLLASQLELGIKMGSGIAPVIPVSDGKVLPEMPLDSFDAGLAAKIPTLVGSNLEEQKLFSIMLPHYKDLDEKALARRLGRTVQPKYVPILIETYRKERAKRGEPTTPYEISSAISTDVMFRRVAIRIAEDMCKIGQRAYNYLFTWKSPAMGGELGACHALEIGFVFGTMEPGFCGIGPEADKLALQIQDAWVSFARNGDPSSVSLGPWPQYCIDRSTMVLGRESHVEKSAYEPERQIWDVIGKPNSTEMP